MAQMKGRACLCATLWLALLPAAPAQDDSAKTVAVFAGVVRDSVSGQPIAKASIRLTAPAPKPAFAGTTGPLGEFRFEAILPGAYRITVTHGGYVDSHFAALKQGRAAFALNFEAGQSVTGAEIRLDPHGTITGRVVNSEGEPLADASVHAYSEQWQRGFRTYKTVASAIANDHGEYRLNVDPGRYYIGSGPPYSNVIPSLSTEGPGKSEIRTINLFYPGVRTMNQAAPVGVQPGQEISGINFKLPEAPTWHVRGTVKPYTVTSMLSALLRERGDNNLGSLGVQVKKDGTFDIGGVVPGSYLLELFPPGPRATGSVGVDVSNWDLNNVIVTGVMPFALTGRVHFEDGSAPPPGFDLRLDKLNWYRINSSSRSTTEADGSFTFQNRDSGEWVLTAQPNGDPYIQSISYNAHDVSSGKLDLTFGAAGGVEVVLGKGAGQINGGVHLPEPASGAPPAYAAELTAELVSENGITGNTGARRAEIDSNGKFGFKFVPPGRYYVFVSSGVDEGLWQNREFLNLVASHGTEVTVMQRGSATVSADILAAADIRQAIERLPR